MCVCSSVVSLSRLDASVWEYVLCDVQPLCVSPLCGYLFLHWLTAIHMKMQGHERRKGEFRGDLSVQRTKSSTMSLGFRLLFSTFSLSKPLFQVLCFHA